jgi:predicted nucleotidyltransferase
MREIARQVKITVPVASRIAKKLNKIGYVKISKVGPSAQVCANLESEFLCIKRIYNLWSLTELTKYLIHEFNHPQAIVVYGSYANGEDIEHSDIDIAVISKTKRELDMSRFEKQLERRIHLIVFDSWRAIPKELRANILNGIKLYGVLECE